MAATAVPWNRLHIPRPAIQSLFTIPLADDTAGFIKDVVAQCITVQSSLRNHALNAEKGALNSILYVYHHRLSYHKPYLALKQAEQCIKRVNAMDLEVSIQEMLDLCPKYIGENQSHCSVPSQPIIELVSVKILGACKLMLRLMDCCCKAFHLCLQHLHLEEFIVLNVVLLGLLSRLWVMHKGIIMKLISLYEAQYALQQEVARFQNMPYIKDFDFPCKIEDFLGMELVDIIKKKLPEISSKNAPPQLLNKIFASHGLDKSGKKAEIAEFREWRITQVDLGRPIQKHKIKRDIIGGFDVKSLCHPVKSNPLKVYGSKQKFNMAKKRQPLSFDKPKNKCIAPLIARVKQAKCFRELSEQIQHAIKWCKRRKFTAGVEFFRNKSLRINKLKYVEALGHSLNNKLRHMKTSICHNLHRVSLKPTHKNSHKPCMKKRQPWNHKDALSCKNGLHKRQKHSITTSVHSKHKTERTSLKKSALRINLKLGDHSLSLAETCALKPCESTNQEVFQSDSFCVESKINPDEKDIDDIFSSIGL